MANSIKYSESSESLALNKGNWWIGTGDSNKGPTVESGYWNAINPPSGGYTVYLNKETNGPSIHSITSDENLISFTNKISGNNYTTVAECLVYYQTQDDKLCVNRDYENIVTDGLVLNLDAGYVPSYPTSGTTWYDLSGNGNNGILINGPTFSGGSMVFDGTNDRSNIFDSSISTSILNSFTMESFLKVISLPSTLHGAGIISIGDGSSNSGNYEMLLTTRNTTEIYIYNRTTNNSNQVDVYEPRDLKVELNEWVHCLITFENGYKRNFLNSIEVGTGKMVDGNLKTTSIDTLRIGIRHNSPYSGILKANISQVRIYNRALTPQEILQNYNAQKGRFGL